MASTEGLQKPGPNGYFKNITFDRFLLEDVIVPYSARLVGLNLPMQTETFKEMLTLPAGSFKVLKTLTLNIVEGSGPPMGVDNPRTAFSISPSLSQVVLRATSFIDPLLLCLPWQQLTFLALGMHNIPADHLLLLVSNCPLLSTCLITSVKDIDADMVTQIASTPVLRLTNLTVLHLSFAGLLNQHQFLQALLLPKVCDPTPPRQKIHDQAPLDCSTFSQNATSSLTHLQLQMVQLMIPLGTRPSYHHFDERFISCVPHVETFEVPAMYIISSSALERIARGELLPSVRRMTFGVDNLRSALEMLEARVSCARKNTDNGQAAISVIKTVVVNCSRNPGMDDMIQGLKDQGIDIRIQILP